MSELNEGRIIVFSYVFSTWVLLLGQETVQSSSMLNSGALDIGEIDIDSDIDMDIDNF